MRSNDGVWIGWDGRIDGEGDRAGTAMDHDGLRLVRMSLSRKEHNGYYRAVANEMIWPLFHDGVRHPSYDADPWESYRRVNCRFADAAAAHTPEGGLVWVHDYHLLLVPGMLRAERPDVRIGLFIHIPVPPRELFATLPWRDEITRSLCSADLIGTQTADDATHMRDCLSCPDPTGQRAAPTVHSPTVDAFPISIDARRFHSAARQAEADGSARAMRERMAGKRTTLLLGVDRLDYTKGIDKRLEAFELVLRRGEIDPEAVRFVQVAVPSREAVADYKDISERVDGLVGRINGVYGGLDGPVVHYVKSGLAEGDLVPLYRAADVMVVTPMRDGMNLVAKEYVASRYDHTGELILSEFAGAVHELGDATIVNPHDVEATADALAGACRRHALGDASGLPAMKRMHAQVMEHDVHEWSAAFLDRLKADARPVSSRADLSSVVRDPIASATRN
jgi:trehalose-6-phosphate synthase